MSITFGPYPCIDPRQLHADAVRLGWPVHWAAILNPWTSPHDVDSGQGYSLLPNSWTNPRGITSGQGWILLTRASLDAIFTDDSDQDEFDLTFSLDPKEVAGLTVAETQAATQSLLHIVQATCVSAGLRDDPNCAYLVELADRRRLARLAPIDAAYNVLSTPGTQDYFIATMNVVDDELVAWGWSDMVEDVWNNLTAWLGDYPGLPFDPDGDPQNFTFYGSAPAIDALGFILDRIGCALVMNAEGVFDIVQVGAEDGDADLALDEDGDNDEMRVWDEDPIVPDQGRIPSTIRVQFPVQLAVADTTGATPWYHIDVSAPGPEGTIVINDDLAAVYDDSDSLTNGTALTSRANERAAVYLLALQADPVRRYYGLPLDDGGLQPGSLVESVRWGDRGRGIVTEVVNNPTVAASPLPATMVAGAATLGTTVRYVRLLCAIPGAYGYPGLVRKYTSATEVHSDANSSSTSIASSIASGTQTVTPASMDGISVGVPFLLVDGLCSSAEIIPTATTDTTFTATFPAAFTAGPGGDGGAGTITSIIVTDGGSGYTGVPDFSIHETGGGSGLEVLPVVVGGVIVSVTIINAGSGFTVAPTITIDGPGGSGTTATVVAVVGGANPGPIILYFAGIWVDFVPDDYSPLQIPDVSDEVEFRATQQENSPGGLSVFLADGGATFDLDCPDGSKLTIYAGRITSFTPAPTS